MSKSHQHLLVTIVVIVCTALFALTACSTADNPTKDNMGDAATEMSEDMKAAGQDARNGVMPRTEDQGYTLYFADSNGKKLVAEQRTDRTTDVTDKKTTDAKARLVLEKLIAGPEESGHKAVLPKSTRINAVTLNTNGVMDIDLSASAVEDFTELGIDEKLTVNAIAASMAQYPEIKKVHLTADKRALRFTDKEYTDDITVDQSLLSK